MYELKILRRLVGLRCAGALSDRFDFLWEISTASDADLLANTPYMNKVKLDRLRASFELSEILEKRVPAGLIPINSPKDLACYLKPQLHGLSHERLKAVFTDSNYHIIDSMTIADGTDCSVELDIQEIFTLRCAIVQTPI